MAEPFPVGFHFRVGPDGQSQKLGKLLRGSFWFAGASFPVAGMNGHPETRDLYLGCGEEGADRLC